MPRILRHEFTQHTHRDWVVAILVGLMIAGLLGFVALYPKRASQASNGEQAATVGLASTKSDPVTVAKKPVRYEATIENWKRYRAANQPAE
jgi:Flp pilus assembly protein CpaB